MKEMKELRAKTGLSQVKFAKRFGIPMRTIQNWENEVNECPIYVFELLSFAIEHDYSSPRSSIPIEEE